MTISPKTKLVVFGNLNYPYGSAPTNRIHAYAKGNVAKKLYYNFKIVQYLK